MKKSLKMWKTQVGLAAGEVDKQVAAELDALAQELPGLNRIYLVQVKKEWSGLPEACILGGIELSSCWERAVIQKDKRRIPVIQRVGTIQL